MEQSTDTDICHTGGLEVERHQLAAAQPHGQGVIVGGVKALPLGVDARQLPPVVLQEALAAASRGKLLSLGLREGGHVPVTGPVRPDLCRQWGRGHKQTGGIQGQLMSLNASLKSLKW